MKRLLVFAFLLFLVALPGFGASATFNYTFSNPVCAGSVTTGCVSGFAVGTVSGTTFTQMATCPLPSTTTGTVSGISCTFTGTAPLGNVTFAVVATYNANGQTGLLSPLIATGTTGSNETGVTVTPSSPSGVVIVFP